ncbi:DoxX family protein [Pseudonocardia sp. CA-107938]|uniref:DoxX family protein n=1 Tax=Pseudonocardia sp. CA-107938 TaxID=3240021 RepID=UPI003D8A4544
MSFTPSPAVRDAALLLARVVLGVVLIAHGLQKFVQNGIAGTAAAFEHMGIPGAPAAALYAAVVELGGGALLLLGAVTSIVAVLVALDMVGALLFVHAGNGVFVAGGGWELVGLILALALVLGAVGAGRFSVDALLERRSPVAARS